MRILKAPSGGSKSSYDISRTLPSLICARRRLVASSQVPVALVGPALLEALDLVELERRLEGGPEHLEALGGLSTFERARAEELAEADAPEHVADDGGLALAGDLKVGHPLREREQVGLGDAHLAAEGLALHVGRVELHEALDGEPALLEPRRDLGEQHRLDELVEGAAALLVELGAGSSAMRPSPGEARVVLVVDVLHQLHLLARLDAGLGEDGGEG
jgi:hypothetical protein